jgi:hypothetical protein
MNYLDKYIKYKTKYLKLKNIDINNQIGGGKKYLFIMFQGSSTNLKNWNEYTESKFLDKLKKIGEVYTYQDKIYNTMHYDKSIPEHNDYNSDIDFDINYNNLDNHIDMVYDDIKIKYKNINEYKLIPVGWSAGGYLALYFSQKYSKKCKLCVLFDTALITKENIILRLKSFKEDKIIYPITNNKYKDLLNKIKDKNDDAWKKIISTSNYIRTLFIKNNINIKFKIPVLSFVYISDPEKNEYGFKFNNDTKLKEIKILKQKNPKKYISYIIKNSGHCIFNKSENASFIIDNIKNNI